MWYDILRFFKHRKAQKAMRQLHAPSSIPEVEPLPDSAPDFHHLGRAGEEEACQFLEQKGYLILFRNWRASRYEVDIIVQRAHTIAFVEVKSRTSMNEQVALDAIDSDKLYNLQRAIGYFRAQYPQYAQFHYQVDAITVRGTHPPFLINHWEDPYHKRFEDHIPKHDHYFHIGRRKKPQY